MKSVDAVGLLDDYITALIALERKVSIQEEDMMLINVGLSSIGLAAVDLATNVFKAQVRSLAIKLQKQTRIGNSHFKSVVVYNNY